MNRRINFFKDYLFDRFGHPLYRIPIDLALSCPHKGKESSGCIYCAEDGARAVHLQRSLNISTQIDEGIKYVNGRYSDAKGNYIAYLQTYTNTFGNIDRLKALYEEVLSGANFKMLMLSTRPDCLSDEILQYLAELNKRIETWVEIGVQTANDKTLLLINRKHDFQSVVDASSKLKAIGIKTSAHIMLGLPNETLDDYVNTVQEVCKLGFTGIKLHNLLILKNSHLGKLFSASAKINSDCIEIDGVGAVPKMNEYEYIDILIRLLRIIPENKVIMRLTADAQESNILFPKWNIPKPKILETLLSVMEERNYTQGDAVGKTIESCDSYLKIKTQDNSFTFYNPLFRENYHSSSGAASEAYYKFVLPSNFTERLNEKQTIDILDVGFGLGYNAFSGLNEINNLGGTANITTLELDDSSLKLALTIFDSSNREHEILTSLRTKGIWTDEKNIIEILLGDARKSVCTLQKKFDVIFLDAFSTLKNPELWTYDFIKKLASLLTENAVIITYSASYAVRGAFVRNKMFVGTTEPFGRKNGGTIASFDKKLIKTPLSEKDLNIILKSTAGTAYRDSFLSSNSKKILLLHAKTISKLRSLGIPKWFNNPMS